MRQSQALEASSYLSAGDDIYESVVDLGEVCSQLNDWGEQGYDGSVPEEVTRTAPSGDRTTKLLTSSASLPLELISPGGWQNNSPGGAVFVPSPLKTGTNL